jgi:hypothetical protein
MNFLRMGVSAYNDLLQIVTPFIEKEDTAIRNAIPTSQRLSAAVRFLVTGQAFGDLKFTNAIGPQTLSEIVLQTREAIIWALKENIKVLNSLAIKLENYDIFQ